MYFNLTCGINYNVKIYKNKNIDKRRMELNHISVLDIFDILVNLFNLNCNTGIKRFEIVCKSKWWKWRASERRPAVTTPPYTGCRTPGGGAAAGAGLRMLQPITWCCSGLNAVSLKDLKQNINLWLILGRCFIFI